MWLSPPLRPLRRLLLHGRGVEGEEREGGGEGERRSGAGKSQEVRRGPGLELWVGIEVMGRD